MSQKTYSKTWCVLPWIHLATLTDGSVQLCCVSKNETSNGNLNKGTLSDSWNNEYMKSVRSKMLAGEPVKACTRCYEEEKNGYRSHRITENNAWVKKIGAQEVEKIVDKTDSEGSLPTDLLTLDLRLGNTCNLQCIMCQPRESSKWVSGTDKLLEEITDKDLAQKLKYRKKINLDLYEWYKNKDFWENLKTIIPSIREIIIAGGEPMLIKEHMEFIEFCANSGEASHIHLRYHTNATLVPESLKKHWEKFERVEMFVSIDGFGAVADYIRYPSQWSEVEKVLRDIDNLPSNTWMRFLMSVNALNIHHLPDFLRWVKKQNYKKEKDFARTGIQGFVHASAVIWPDYLNPKVLPREFKDKVTKSVEACFAEFPGQAVSKYQGVINLMNSEDWSHQIPTLKNYLSGLDKMRGTDFTKTFPEFSKSLKKYEENRFGTESN